MGDYWYLMLLLIVPGMLITAWRAEVRTWNDGHCKCGYRWRWFDNDSHGGRGYTCDSCDRTCWISYPGVEKHTDDPAR